MTVRKIKPWEENIYGFEGFFGAHKETSLCLERVVCTLDALERGVKLPAVNLIHYKTERLMTKKRKMIDKKIQISKHNYDLTYGLFESANYDGGHTRAMASTIGKHPIPANITEIEDAWDIQTIPHDKEKFTGMELKSDYGLFEKNRHKYSSIPEGIQNPKRIPSKIEIGNFFYDRQDRKVTSQEIIDNLYK
jgi:hypothetical protein